MNKNELVESIAAKANMTKSEAGRALEAFVECVTETLNRGDEIRLVGFGTFLSVKSASRSGRNPRTGEKINIPASIQPRFRAGKGLKEALN